MLSKHACLQGTEDQEQVRCGLCWPASPGATVQNERMRAPPPHHNGAPPEEGGVYTSAAFRSRGLPLGNSPLCSGHLLSGGLCLHTVDLGV